jgi:hypothetical protein
MDRKREGQRGEAEGEVEVKREEGEEEAWEVEGEECKRVSSSILISLAIFITPVIRGTRGGKAFPEIPKIPTLVPKTMVSEKVTRLPGTHSKKIRLGD